MNIHHIAPLLKKKYRPIIICRVPGCNKAIVEGTEMNIEQLNERWLSLMVAAPKVARDEVSTCPCVAGCDIKNTIGIVVIDVVKAKGVDVKEVLSPQNISITKFQPE